MGCFVKLNEKLRECENSSGKCSFGVILLGYMVARGWTVLATNTFLGFNIIFEQSTSCWKVSVSKVSQHIVIISQKSHGTCLGFSNTVSVAQRLWCFYELMLSRLVSRPIARRRNGLLCIPKDQNLSALGLSLPFGGFCFFTAWMPCCWTVEHDVGIELRVLKSRSCTLHAATQQMVTPR
jgi:hypothetical protein